MIEIPLTQEQVALIDDEDYAILRQCSYCAVKKGLGFYARRCATKEEQTSGSPTRIYLHREIMRAKKGQVIDHINGNTLDNRKENLRFCTTRQNSRNAKKNTNNSSGFKGVAWHKNRKVWVAYIKVDYKNKHLGVYNTPESAAKAYDEAAKKYFGEFAKLNFLEE